MKAPEMLFWSNNGQALVPAGHPEAHTQAYFEGQEIPDEHALKVISGVKNKMVTAPERKAAPPKRATEEER
jgi:hypothetical protein